MKQRELMDTHVLFTITGLEDTIRFFQPLRSGFEGRIERLRSMGILPLGLYALTNHSEADFITLGGLLPQFDPSPFHPQIPDKRDTATPSAVSPTPLDLSMDTSDSELDADGEFEVDEFEDDEDPYADGSGGNSDEAGEI